MVAQAPNCYELECCLSTRRFSTESEADPDFVRPTSSTKQASDLTLGGAAVDRLLRPLDASLQARQGGLDALAEACVHRLFLLLSLSRTHQKERLAPIRAGADLGFDPVRTCCQSRRSATGSANFFSSLLLARAGKRSYAGGRRPDLVG